MKTKNVLIGAVAMLLVAVLSLSGATYAWLSFENIVTISSFDTSVVTGVSLQASLDGEDNWQNVFLFTDLDASGNLIRPDGAEIAPDVFRPTVLDAATIGYDGLNYDNVNDKIIDMDDPDEEGTGTVFTPVNNEMSFYTSTGGGTAFVLKKAEAGTHYISLKLYFRASATATGKKVRTTINLDTLFSRPAVPSGKTDVLKSLRAGFAVRPVKDATGAAITPLDAGEYKGTYVKDAISGGAALEQNQIQTAPGNLYGWLKDKKFNKYSSVTSPLTLFEIEGAQVWELNAYIWLEGFDEDCITSITGTAFASAFTFTGAEI